MLNILNRIFGIRAKQEKFPEAVVKEAIEKTVEKTDPWIRAVFDYKYKLRQPVINSLEYVEELVSGLPPALPIKFDVNLSCPSLAVFFDSHTDMLKMLRNDRELAVFFREHDQASKELTALLIMEKSEKTIFSAELSGNVVARDVPQTSVTFLSQRFLEPASSEVETRHRLSNRAFEHLLKLVHKQVTTAKSIRKDLERRRTLLQSKLALLERGDGNPDEPKSSTIESIAEVLNQLREIEVKLKEQGGEDKMLSFYLDIAANFLSHPDDHLWETEQHLILDQTGIKRAHPTENGSDLTLHELCNSEGQKWVMLLVTLSVDDLRMIYG